MNKTPRYQSESEDDGSEDYGDDDYEEDDFDAYVTSPSGADQGFFGEGNGKGEVTVNDGINTGHDAAVSTTPNAGAGTKSDTDADTGVVGLDLASYMNEMQMSKEKDGENEEEQDPSMLLLLEGLSPNPNSLNQKMMRSKIVGSSNEKERKSGQSQLSSVDLIKASLSANYNDGSPRNPPRPSNDSIPPSPPYSDEASFTLSPSKTKVKINSDLVERAKARLKEQELKEKDNPFEVRKFNGGMEGQKSSDVQALLKSVSKENKETRKEEEEDNSNRVDALLMELFPEKAELFTSISGLGKPKKGAKQKKNYGMAAKSPSKASSPGDNGQESEPESAGDALQQANAEVRRLKKELKAKDEKLARVTEHSMMLGAHMDKVKGESAVLSNKLNATMMEINAKETRIQSLLKGRKKSKMKEKGKEKEKRQQQRDEYSAMDSAAPLPFEVSATLEALETENIALNEREGALLAAVEELSIQNEDLIAKLKESMARELEMSSNRAAAISAAAFSLPRINQPNHSSSHPNLQANANSNMGRAQSEPVGDRSDRDGNSKRQH